MTLTLSVLRCPDAVPPETKRINGGELRIGRGPDNDWIMPDPEKMLSKRHCVVAFRNGAWAIADTSTNGTYLNRDSDPLGTGQVRGLEDGDRIRIGAYEIEVRISEESAYAPPAAGYGARQGSPFEDPFGDDVFADKPAARETFTSAAFGNDPLFGGPAQPRSITLPGRFDPLAPSSDDSFLSGPTQADHTPAFSDSFRPPAVTQGAAIPDDEWDLSLSPSRRVSAAAPPAFAPQPLPPPAAAPPQYAPPPQPQAFAPPPAAPAYAPPPAQPAAFVPQPPPQPAPPAAFAPRPPPPPQAYAPPPQPAQLYTPPPAPVASPFEEDPFAPSVTTPPPAAVQVVPLPGAPIPAAPMQAAPVQAVPQPAYAPPPASEHGDRLLAAFMQGAGMDAARPENPEALMRGLGAAFRAMVSGLRQAMIARASIKGEFRIEQTMIRSRGNNPLKFSADDDDALSALLGLGRRSEIKPDAAIADALRDMRLHELATVAAMQDAVRALLAQLAPAKLREQAQAGGMTLLPAQKTARAFEAYEKLHDNVTRALADDFDSVFGKSFARAYEVALRDISAKDTP